MNDTFSLFCSPQCAEQAYSMKAEQAQYSAELLIQKQQAECDLAAASERIAELEREKDSLRKHALSLRLSAIAMN